MISVVLYTRKDSQQCEQTQRDLENLQELIPHRVVIIDVDSDKKLRRKFGGDVPVVEVGPYQLKTPFTSLDLQITLAAARDREKDIQKIENSPGLVAIRQRVTWTKADGISLWIARHYLLVLNILVFIYMGLPFLFPILMKFGSTTPASWINKGYSLVCHQLAYRSIFLFGEQPFYPRAAAGVVGLKTFNQVTGLGEGNTTQEYLEARAFTGNDFIGYKVVLCERDVAIYAGILLFGLIFPLTKRRIPVIPWYIWVIVGIIPIGLDGFSQLLSQPPYNFFPYRESTPFLRILTGGLFGLFTAWFSYPLVEESMAETRRVMEDKLRRIQL
jgi:uncharacterized membrane protein